MRRRTSAARVARLATVRDDGRPHLVPITFALVGDVVCSAIDDKPKSHTNLVRLANIEVHPEVAVLVDEYADDWSRLWWVRLDGEASVLRSGRHFEAALNELAQKYATYADRRPRGPVIAIEVGSWTGWSAS